MSFKYGLVVRKESIKSVKDILEERGLLQKSMKVIPYSEHGLLHSQDYKLATIPIACKGEARNTETDNVTSMSAIIALNAILGNEVACLLENDIIKVIILPRKKPRVMYNPLQQAILEALSFASFSSFIVDINEMLNVLPKSYGIYEPMLLLPPHAFTHDLWDHFLHLLQAEPHLEDHFFATIAHEMGVTHVAINAPIPAHNASSLSEPNHAGKEENLLRSPISLQTIHGNFGPALAPFPAHVPTINDFDQAFWVSTRQNGIVQVWAPRYTMFSSGNVTEKARILKLSTVKTAVDNGRHSGRGCSAVDLFAGIGYFAFSYAKAGVSKVVCWDLNPWSVEGFRRGASANKWSCRIVEANTPQGQEEERGIEGIDEGSIAKAYHGNETFLIYSESNEKADDRIALLRTNVPPIRHVNCGMLPSVGHAWKTAVKALDPDLGGWLHLHETVAEKQIEARAEYFRLLVLDYATSMGQTRKTDGLYSVSVDHIERVKSVGPRLWHIVVDIHVTPSDIEDT